MRIETDKIYCGDSLQVLQTLPDNCLDCCVTSPPYYALRDYGTDGQIGREATPEEYVVVSTVAPAIKAPSAKFNLTLLLSIFAS